MRNEQQSPDLHSESLHEHPVVLRLLCPTADLLGYTNRHYETQSVLFTRARYRQPLKRCANTIFELWSAIRILIPHLSLITSLKKSLKLVLTRALRLL